MTPGTAAVNGKNPRHSKVSAGDFRMGRFARRGASLRQCTGNKRVGEQTACVRQKPVQGEFSTFCGSCCGNRKCLPGMVSIKEEQKNSRHSRASAGDFSMGQFARCSAPPCGSAPGGNGSGKPDQLTPVLSAGTVRGRAGCVKSRSVQTFPHFAGRPVENRGRAGDRKNRLSQWNSRF